MSDEAILLLTANGSIQYASTVVSQWWQVPPGALHGDAFSNLFAFDVVSADPEWLETQWHALLDTACTPNGVNLAAQPKLSAPFDITVRLEKIPGSDPAVYFAHARKTVVGSHVAAPPETILGNAQRFAPLIDRGSMGFFDFDYANRHHYLSPAWKNQLGYLEKEITAQETTWRELVHPEDSAAAPDKPDRRSSNLTRSYHAEFRMRTKGGSYEWVQCNGVRFFGEDGIVQRVQGTMSSIQERKEFEDSCIASEERLGVLARQADLAAFDLDFASGHYWLSAGLRKLTGYLESELPDSPESFAHLLPAELVPRGAQAWFSEKQPGDAVLRETLELRGKESRNILVNATFVRTFDRRKALQRVLGLLVPGAAPGAPARMSPVLLRSAFDAISEGIVVTDRESKVVFVNSRASRMLGIDPAAAEGSSAADLIPLIHRLNQTRGESPIVQVLEHGEVVPLNDEHSIPAPGGLRRIVFTCVPVKDTDGTTQGAVFVFRDPEEMTLTPDELIRSNRFEMLGMLAGGIAHDFNNLLTTILGGISIAREARNYSQLEDSEKGCMAAKALTRQLLALARGGADLRQILNPAEVLQEAVRLASVGTSVRVDLLLADDLYMIHADKAEIIRVFQNLILNAIQAIPQAQGNVWVQANNATIAGNDVPTLPAGDYVHFEVKDNGCGIPQEHLQKIFEPFFTTKKSGTGLGLPTVNSIIKNHSGAVGVDSTVGVGTTFSIFLPRADQPVAEIQREAPSLRFGTGRILVMDDEEKILHLTGIMLENLGYKFDVARNAKDAIGLFQRYLNLQRPYDCVILDLTIVGGIGGEETFREMRKLQPDVCAVISSGYDSEEMMRRYLDMGFRGYLSKPYRVGELGKILKKVLG